MQQKYENPDNYRAEIFQIITLKKNSRAKLIHVEERKKYKIAETDSLVDKSLTSSRIKLSKSYSFDLDGVETGV